MKFILAIRHLSLLEQNTIIARTFILGVFIIPLIALRQDTSTGILLAENPRDLNTDRVNYHSILI